MLLYVSYTEGHTIKVCGICGEEMTENGESCGVRNFVTYVSVI